MVRHEKRTEGGDADAGGDDDEGAPVVLPGRPPEFCLPLQAPG
ncbi:MAG: hypothetical protein ACE5HA_15265 [Anaerolineae bacterium]